VELAVLLEQLGWGADPSPFLATTTQHLPLVAEAFPVGSAVRDERLAAIAGGSPGAAVLEPGITATADGDGWLLSGTALHVLDADRADELAVVVTTDAGVGVALVPGSVLDASREPTVDASLRLCTVVLDGTRVPGDRLVAGPDTAVAVERARHVALTGLSASMVGAAQRTFDLVLDHIKTRHQFGQPIGGFQAVKHLAVDVHVALERARALVQFAALAIAEDDDRRTLAASLAKAAAGDAQRISSQHGIQLFGGLGYTWENDLQLFVRRAKVGEMLLGSAHQHRVAISGMVLAGEQEGAVR
jgi:alkylation response protein AidB-like acyl-CoA dehydrogenase